MTSVAEILKNSRLMKYAFRQVLGWIKEQYDAAQQTPTKVDDIGWSAAYNVNRRLAITIGFIDDGGPDDPGPLKEDLSAEKYEDEEEGEGEDEDDTEEEEG